MQTQNKRLVSVRLNNTDFARLKHIAQRLRVRDSDVIRFAVKSVLTKLAPLHDVNLRGADLLPAFVELGSELSDYFEFDAAQLEEIVNDGVANQAKRVSAEDVALLAMLSLPEHYLYMKLREVCQLPVESMGITATLREYLYDKYSRRHADGAGMEALSLIASK
jgi:hypothetical protein